ncbi:MAG: hypothetical protein BJ554DRAFT_5288 [Olpidium bornovanus]|uniref:Uncharacterized protein n=1 Tax=Olpidium bornovanus TaxID=278681 RepID=A0A8H7ZZY4_9FUNG|nr:MAG: hypothetical protein BJ554DRAFT_5288 [Olpidium bornovanus]
MRTISPRCLLPERQNGRVHVTRCALCRQTCTQYCFPTTPHAHGADEGSSLSASRPLHASLSLHASHRYTTPIRFAPPNPLRMRAKPASSQVTRALPGGTRFSGTISNSSGWIVDGDLDYSHRNGRVSHERRGELTKEARHGREQLCLLHSIKHYVVPKLWRGAYPSRAAWTLPSPRP